MPERSVRTVFIGVSYSAAWALLIVKWVDHVVTITFDSRSDHSCLYFPCRFFCCLECHVNRIPPSLPSSVRADFWLATWTGWVLLFLCSFLWMGAMCVSSASPVRFWIFMFMLQGNLRFYEMIHGGSPLELRAFDLSTNFGLVLFREAWAYQLKISLQGALEFVDWSRLARVSFISWCFIDAVWNLHFMSRSGIGAPSCRYTLQMFVPVFFIFRIQIVESISSTYLVCV